MAQLGKYMESGLPDVATKGIGAYTEMLGGASPQYSIDLFNKYLRPERERVYQESVLPAIREASVGPGTFYGSQRVAEESRARQSFEEENLTATGRMIESERAGVRTQLGMLPEVSGLVEEAPLRRAQAGVGFGALPRLAKQAELTAQFEEYKRTQPELSPIIDDAMAFLGLTTQAGFWDPGQPGLFQELIGPITQAASAAAGMGGV